MMFLKRLSSTGIVSSKYYTDKMYSVFAGSSNDFIPDGNCTAYASGRTAELKDGSSAEMMKGGAFPNAKEWITRTTWAYDDVPTLGGVMVWGSPSSVYGHVAVCEDVKPIDNGSYSVTVSQSNWNMTFFEVKTYVVKKGEVTSGVGYPFLGCIHNPYVKDGRVERNTSKLQVNVLADSLRVRDSANGNFNGLYIPQGMYDVLDTQESAGYMWVKVEEGVWFATNPGWTELYKPISDEPEELKSEVEELRKANESLSLENKKLADEIDVLKTKASELQTKIDAIMLIID